MKILYHDPNPNTIYASRTIHNAYKNAFEDLGHEFRFFTPDDEIRTVFNEYRPDIFFTSLTHFHFKYLDINLLKDFKQSSNLKVFIHIPFWMSPLSKLRINEGKSLKDDIGLLKIIQSGVGDCYYNPVEGNDFRMDGFESTTGYKHHTIPLAADSSIISPEYDDLFQADISFIGTYLPEKRMFFKERVMPLRSNYKLKLYGQDWTFLDRALGWVQRGGQYFNMPYIRSLRKPKLKLGDERKIYNSSLISINVHEEYQRKFGGDCNERTFKIPLAGGFEITDDVACIHKYFKAGEEIVVAENKQDWFDKINYYIKNPDKRLEIIEKGKARVAKDHTYHNRVGQIIDIYKFFS